MFFGDVNSNMSSWSTIVNRKACYQARFYGCSHHDANSYVNNLRITLIQCKDTIFQTGLPSREPVVRNFSGVLSVPEHEVQYIIDILWNHIS